MLDLSERTVQLHWPGPTITCTKFNLTRVQDTLLNFFSSLSLVPSAKLPLIFPWPQLSSYLGWEHNVGVSLVTSFWECPSNTAKTLKKKQRRVKGGVSTLNPHLLGGALSGHLRVFMWMSASCEQSLWGVEGDSCLLVSLSKNDTNAWEDKNPFVFANLKKDVTDAVISHFTSSNARFVCEWTDVTVSTAEKCFESIGA